MKFPRDGQPLRIAIERSVTAVPSLTGIQRYATALLDGVPSAAAARGVRLEVVDVPYPRIVRAFESPLLRKVMYLVWLNLFFPFWVRGAAIDCVHHTNFLVPMLLKPAPTVATIHDLRCCEQTFSWWYALYRRFCVRRSCRQADALVVPSQDVRRRLCRFFAVDPNRVDVVYHGFREPLRSRGESSVRDGAVDRYLLMTGPLLPAKNHITGLKALQRLLSPGQPYRLIITGAPTGEYGKLRNYVLRHGLGAWVEFAGHVSDEALVELYRRAFAVLFPSTVEGFGYPLIEAMALGTPVISSDLPVLREIGGEAVIYADPHNDAEWYSRVRQLEDSLTYHSAVQAGLRRASLFAEEKEVSATLAVYLRVLGLSAERPAPAWEVSPC